MAYNQPQVQATLGKLDDQTLIGMLNRPGGVLPPSTPMDIQQQLAKNAQTRQSQMATAGAPAQMPAVPSAPPPNTPAGISGLQAPNMTAMAEGGIVPGMEGGEDPNALLLQQIQAELAKRTGSGAPGIAGMAKGGKVQHFDKGGFAGWVKDVLLGNPYEQLEEAVAAAKTPEEKYAIRQSFARKPIFESNPMGYWGDQYSQWAESRDAQLKADAIAAQQARIAQGLELPPAPKTAALAAAPSATTPPAAATPGVSPDLSKVGTPPAAGMPGKAPLVVKATDVYQGPQGLIPTDPNAATKLAASMSPIKGDTDVPTLTRSSGAPITNSASASGTGAGTPGANQDPTEALRRNYKALRELAGIDKDDEDYRALLAAQRAKVDARNPLELAGLAAISRIGNVQPGRSGWASLGAGLGGLAEGWGQGIASKQQAQDALTNAELARVGARGKMNEGIAKVATDMLGYRSPEQRQLDELAKIDATGKWHERVAGIHEAGRGARAAAGADEGPDPLKVAQYVQRAEDSFAKLNQSLKMLNPQQYEAGMENARQKAIEEFFTLAGQPLPKAYAARKDAANRMAAVMGGVSGVQVAPAK